MKCDDLQQRLDDYLDGELDSILVVMVEDHLDSCGHCKNTVLQGRILQAGLKQIVTNESLTENVPHDEFVSSAFKKVRARYPETEINNRWSYIGIKTGFVTALAAGFALWAVLTTFILPTMDSTTIQDKIAISHQASKIATLNLDINVTRIVRIAINTPEEFDQVTLSVILPKHIELKGHKNKRELSWDTKLAKGNNILRIPLKAINYGQGDFIARITHNGKVKIFKLFLKSNKPDLSDINAIKLQV